MNILTIADSHTATASLICNDHIEACVSEERFSRNKCEMGYPRESINYCLSVLGKRELDQVIYMGKNPPDPWGYRSSHSTTFSVQDMIDINYGYYKPVLVDKVPVKEAYKKYFQSLFENFYLLKLKEIYLFYSQR